MSYYHLIKIITPATPGLLSRLELAEYCDVDESTIGGIAQRFGPENSEGHFPERAVWRKILGLEPERKEAADHRKGVALRVCWRHRGG